jgi:hypothetical protein
LYFGINTTRNVCIDDNTAAVTSGSFSPAPGISIVNIAGLSITKFVPLPDKPYGITYYDDSLICCVVNIITIFDVC